MRISDDGPVVVLTLPDGTAAAFATSELIEARDRAVKLGFTPRAHQQGTNLNSDTERLLDSKALGEVLGVNATTVEAMAKDGRLPSIRIGRLLRFEPRLCLARLRAADGGRL